MAGSISTRTTLIRCLESFNQLFERVEQSDYGREDEVDSVSWMDELGRLRIWAANTGALRTGQSSLDFQLRDSSHIKQQVVELLEDLGQTILETTDALSEDVPEASDDGEFLDAGHDESPKTQLQQLYEGVVTIINCLYRMSMLIRRPAEHDLLVGSHESEKSQLELHSHQHISNMHPEADDRIAQRLKRTILQRRKDLDTRARRQLDLEIGTEEAQSIHDTTTEDAIYKNIVAEEQDVEFKQPLSKSGTSRSSHAASRIDGGQISVPPPPKGYGVGKPFQCPYCFFVIELRDMRSWARHVFRDIKPYVCVFPDCNTPDLLYDTRREWAFHETTTHNTESPLCPLCKEIFGSSKKFERHVARHLEELALLSLPRDEVEDEKEEGDSHVRLSEGGTYTALDSADSESTGDDVEGGNATEPVSYKFEPAGMVGEKSEGLESSLGEVLFFTCLSFTILGIYLGHTSPLLVISLVVLSLGLLLLLWPEGITLATCSRYKTGIFQLCVLVYIVCAALSLYVRLQARNFGFNVILVLLREQTITSIWKIDLIACAATVFSHLIGHHDSCDRIHRRVLWFGKQLHRFSSGRKPDLELGQSVGIRSSEVPETSQDQGRKIPGLVDGPDLPTLQERFRYLRSLPMSKYPYTVWHQIFFRTSARLRWTTVRDRFIYHKPPMQGFYSMAASEARVSSAKAIASQRSPRSTPVFQIPGFIETISVKALPNTRLSQNVIDKDLVQGLFPSIPVFPHNESTDNFLIALDGQPISCVGKIYLLWLFKDESEKYYQWFYIVENCARGIIIGNDFLQQTEIMSNHRHRLEITKPSEFDNFSTGYLSEDIDRARPDECLDQLVLGRINIIDTVASLDTGCGVNFISLDYAKSLNLIIMPLSVSQQYIKYADGRQGLMLGQVEADWSFFDDPDKAVKVIFYVLHICFYPVIFGERFIFSEDPWFYHEATPTDGVMGLEKARRSWGLFGSYKPDPQEKIKQRERMARNKRAETLLQTQLRAR